MKKVISNSSKGKTSGLGNMGGRGGSGSSMGMVTKKGGRYGK